MDLQTETTGIEDTSIVPDSTCLLCPRGRSAAKIAKQRADRARARRSATPPEALRTPANVQPYVAALGEDLALALILRFAGTRLHVGAVKPRASAKAVALIGADGVRRLADALNADEAKVPTVTEWVIAMLYLRGWTTSQIAVRLFTTESNVRRKTAPLRKKGR